MTARLMDVVVVWDREENPGIHTGERVWLWASNGRSDEDSIPRYVEANAERLRETYLAFVHEIGEARLGHSTIVERLARQDGFSFWWMGLISEKSPFKSLAIYDCVRLLALEERLVAERPTMVRLEGGDHRLARSLRALCARIEVAFEHSPGKYRSRRWTARRAYEALPAPARAALAFARHLCTIWPLRHVRARRWHSGSSAVTICSYFIHLDAARCKTGNFYSRQWESLPEFLASRGRRLNWVHHFLESKECPSADRGRSWCEAFERHPNREGHHTFINSYVTLSIVLQALRDFFRTWVSAPSERRIQILFYAPGSRAWLWPLLKADWLDSIAGPVAMMNCLWMAQFDDLFATMPRQDVGLYLYENQGWERALLHAWRKYGHGRIVAVQHATVPFWHLNYAQDPRTTQASGPFALPRPDAVAVNGPSARRALVEGAYPASELVDVEALRYFEARQNERRSVQASETDIGDLSPYRVLLLGDILHDAMIDFVAALEDAVPGLASGFEFTFKPHPGHPVELPDSLRTRVISTNEALANIMPYFDAAVSANSTSAAVDASIAGLAVLIMHTGANLNLSPLRGEPGVRFARSPLELRQQLEEMRAWRVTMPQRAPIFFLDRELPRWQDLLGRAEVAPTC